MWLLIINVLIKINSLWPSDTKWRHGSGSTLAQEWLVYHSQITRFMGPTWGQSGATRTQVGPMLAPWSLLSGPLFTKKTSSYGYRDPHDKPKTVWRPSQVYNGNLYTDKTASSQWIEARVGSPVSDQRYMFSQTKEGTSLWLVAWWHQAITKPMLTYHQA